MKGKVMNNLRRGDTGRDVVRLQMDLANLGYDLNIDGDFGPATEDALKDFQTGAGLLDDGVAGPLTYSALRVKRTLADGGVNYKGWSTYKADPVLRKGKEKGYNTHALRTGAPIRAYKALYKEAHRLGTVVTSSGSRRNLSAGVTRNRSARSLHYLGIALDLYLYSAMVDPETDPYVVVRDPDAPRYWRIYARVPCGGTLLELEAQTYKKLEPVTVIGEFIDFTALMRKHGFAPIPCRRSFWRALEDGKRNDGGAEWWHFQYEKDLITGVTRFGDLLLEVWTLDDLLGSGPWQYADYLWSGKGYFDKR